MYFFNVCVGNVVGNRNIFLNDNNGSWHYNQLNSKSNQSSDYFHIYTVFSYIACYLLVKYMNIVTDLRKQYYMFYPHPYQFRYW